MKIKLTKPLILDEKEVKEIDLKLDELTGKDVLKIDLELRNEGVDTTYAGIYNQKSFLLFASKSSGILADDLEKLHVIDFMEVTFSVRNFLLGSSEGTESSETSEKSF